MSEEQQDRVEHKGDVGLFPPSFKCSMEERIEIAERSVRALQTENRVLKAGFDGIIEGIESPTTRHGVHETTVRNSDLRFLIRMLDRMPVPNPCNNGCPMLSHCQVEDDCNEMWMRRLGLLAEDGG